MVTINIIDLNTIRTHFALRYQVFERLGEGGMAVVYRAKQKLTGRMVALKILKPELYNDSVSLSRFYQEVRIGATLQHPNLRKMNYGENFNGLHFLEMEYLNGDSLFHYIRGKGHLSQNKTLQQILPVVNAVSFLHNKGIVHRDIKSANIFITKNKRVVVTDLGISCYVNHNETTPDRDQLITPEYSSPEDLSGILFPDIRSDLYSLGVVIYECLSGRLPFKRDTIASTIRAVVEKEPPHLNIQNLRISGKLEFTVMKLLEKKPENRYQSAYELWHELKKLEQPRISIGFGSFFKKEKQIKKITLPYFLEVIASDDKTPAILRLTGREIEKGKYLCIIGRKTTEGVNPDVDIQHNTISRQHCEIIFTNDWVGIRHLYSDNPTSINNDRLSSGEIYPIKPDDTLSVGDINLRFKRF